MAADNTDLLALMGNILRAVDRQTEENKRTIDELGRAMREGFVEMRQAAQESNTRIEAIFDRFATAVADGFIRVEKKIDGVKQEVAGLRTDVQHIDERLVRIEANQAAQADMLRRLEVLENIVLRKAS